MTPAPAASAARRIRPRPVREKAQPGLGRGPGMRLLPLVIVAAIFMLGFRIQVVVEDISNHTLSASVLLEKAVAFAAQAPAAAPAPAPAATPPVDPAAAPTETDGATPAEGDEAVADTEGVMDAATPGGPPLPLNFDPTALTKSEIDTLQRLAERRELIEQREREISTKDGLLQAAEARIDGKIGQLQDLEKEIQALLQQYDVKQQAEIEQLVRIYGAMKPKDAARIFDSLEMPILLAVAQAMRENKVAPIMALMNAQKATALTEEMSTKRHLPNPAAPGGPQG